MNPLLPAAWLMGLAGSAHCIGMCGPIAVAVPVPTGWRYGRAASTALLNVGRTLSYALLGAAFGAFGGGLRLAGLQQGVSIAAGALILLTVLLPVSVEQAWITGRVALWIGRVRALMARHLRRTVPGSILLTGMLNGLLPCGLLYGGLLGAAASGSAWNGALFMGFFAFGTWPALMAARFGQALFAPSWRQHLRRVAPYAMSALGVLLILRGLDLGIPFVSPAAPKVAEAAAVCH